MTNPTHTPVEVTQADREAAAQASGFDSWEDAVYWSNLAKQSAVQNLAERFARHRIASSTRAVDTELLEAAKALVPTDFNEHRSDFAEDWHRLVAAITKAEAGS